MAMVNFEGFPLRNRALFGVGVMTPDPNLAIFCKVAPIKWSR